MAQDILELLTKSNFENQNQLIYEFENLESMTNMDCFWYFL